MSHRFVRRWVACAAIVAAACTGADGSRSRAAAPEPVPIEQSVVDAAMQRLLERQQRRAAETPTTQPADSPDADPSDPFNLANVRQHKLERIRAYQAQVTAARAALRQRLIPASEVRRLNTERAAFQALPLERLRELLIEADQSNADRLERYRDAFGDLPSAARTVTVILMKSGQIDFATPLPEDPLTREVEEARGVRRAYFQFYLNPPNGTPRRHNGFVEFVYDHHAALWVPTWADYSGEPIPLFDAEAFVPLRPYQIVYDGKTFVVAQSHPIRPPQVFALLTPRWRADAALFGPAERW